MENEDRSSNEDDERGAAEKFGAWQSDRVRQQPSHLQEYEVDLPQSIDHTHPTSNSGSSMVHTIAHYVSYNKFSPAHRCFLTAISEHDESIFSLKLGRCLNGEKP